MTGWHIKWEKIIRLHKGPQESLCIAVNKADQDPPMGFGRPDAANWDVMAF